MKKLQLLLAIFVVASMVMSACVAPSGQAPAAAGTGGEEETVAGDLTRPHPALSDPLVRKAIAHCIDRDALIASVYTFVDDKAALRMDSFVPKTHWAYSGPYTDYAYSPDNGNALLEQAGWTDTDGDGVNDLFGPVGHDLSAFEMRIFDRWGEVIFSTSDPGQPWDGKVNGGGAIAQKGVYVWKVKATGRRFGPVEYVGSVALVK